MAKGKKISAEDLNRLRLLFDKYKTEDDKIHEEGLAKLLKDEGSVDPVNDVRTPLFLHISPFLLCYMLLCSLYLCITYHFYIIFISLYIISISPNINISYGISSIILLIMLYYYFLFC